MEEKKDVSEELIKKRLKEQKVKEPTFLNALNIILSIVIPCIAVIYILIFLYENLYIKELYWGATVIDRSLTFKEPLEFPSFPIGLFLIIIFFVFIVFLPIMSYVLDENYKNKAKSARKEILEEQKQQKEAIKEAIREIKMDNTGINENEIDSLISKLEALKQAKSDNAPK